MEICNLVQPINSCANARREEKKQNKTTLEKHWCQLALNLLISGRAGI